MKIHSPLFLLAALGALTACGPTFAAADTTEWTCKTCPYPKAATGYVDVGIGNVSDESAQFGDYTGLQKKGAFLDLGGRVRYRGDGGYYADLSAANLGLDSRSLAMRSGHEGQYGLRIAYDELPRHLASGAMTPFIGSGGHTLTLPAGYPAQLTSAMPLATTLQPVDIGFKKQRLDVGATLVTFQNWVYRASFTRDVRDGTRPTTGSFFANASQLVAPVDHVTDQLELSASYATAQMQASLTYQLSRFSNGHESLTWSNPFSPVGDATQGQLALAPDNQMHLITASAGYTLSPSIRASADVSVGRLTQNAEFLPPTLNASLAARVQPFSPAATSLNGKVDTFNANVKVSATLMDDLRVTALYARNVRDNNTAIQAYPSVAADTFYRGEDRSNTPFDLTQDRFKVHADYRGFEAAKLSGGVDVDYRSRPYHEAVKTTETTVWARAGMQPTEALALSVKLAQATRNHSTYGTATWFEEPENPLMRKYNLAARDRSTAGLRADFTVNEQVRLGLGVDYANDDYRSSTIGLTQSRSLNLSADLSADLSEQTQLSLFAHSETIDADQAGSQLFGAPDWTARHEDRFDTVGLAFKHAMIVGKLDVGADVSVSRANSFLDVQTATNVPAFPRAKTAIDSVKLYANYKLQDNMWINASLWQQSQIANDWRLDGVAPNTVFNLLSFGEQAPHYRVNVFKVSLRYRF